MGYSVKTLETPLVYVNLKTACIDVCSLLLSSEKMLQAFHDSSREEKMMKTTIISLLFIFAASLFFVSCQTVPVTGRSQLDIIPSQQINAMSAEEYHRFLSQHEVVKGTAEARMVENVGRKIQQSVESYLADQGKSQITAGFEWEFNLVQDDAVNAFAMPGGKVVIYTGIMKIAQNEAGLATVTGHEIAHVIANHGGERLSQQLLAQLGIQALDIALSQKPELTRQIFLSAVGLGTQIGIMLPFSRLHETEADKLGLIFMAMAGYDPHVAIDFWQRMSAQSQGASPPEFLSTHPSHETRIETLRNYIPEAMKYYR